MSGVSGEQTSSLAEGSCKAQYHTTTVPSLAWARPLYPTAIQCWTAGLGLTPWYHRGALAGDKEELRAP